MAPVYTPQDEPRTNKIPARKNSGIGATEDQMDIRGTIPQRIDRKGTKIEDVAGVGGHDSSGG